MADALNRDDVYKPHTLDELRAAGVDEAVISRLDPERRYGVWCYGRRTFRRWREPGTYRKRSQVIHWPRSEWVPAPVLDIGVSRSVVEADRKSIASNARPSRASRRV